MVGFRYLLYDVHHFTPETETSVNMMVSHREVFEKVRPHHALFLR